MLAEEIYVSAVCFSPFGFRCSIFPLTVHLPLRRLHCCLDSSPLKVIKKSLPSCAQRLCFWKQGFENRVRKITLSVKTLLLTCKDSSPALPPRWPLCTASQCGTLVFLDPSYWGAYQMGHSLCVGRASLHSYGVPQACIPLLSPASRGCVRCQKPTLGHKGGQGEEYGHRRACSHHWLLPRSEQGSPSL